MAQTYGQLDVSKYPGSAGVLMGRLVSHSSWAARWPDSSVLAEVLGKAWHLGKGWG